MVAVSDLFALKCEQFCQCALCLKNLPLIETLSVPTQRPLLLKNFSATANHAVGDVSQNFGNEIFESAKCCFRREKSLESDKVDSFSSPQTFLCKSHSLVSHLNLSPDPDVRGYSLIFIFIIHNRNVFQFDCFVIG